VNWWLCDSGGTLYLAPALILWLGLERDLDQPMFAAPELDKRSLVVWGGIAALSLLLFLTPPLEAHSIRAVLPFLLVVPLSWIALRMSLRSAYTLVTLVAIVATAATVAGFGPFQNTGAGNPLRLVGALVVLLAMNVLTIVALVSERHEAENANKVKSMFLATTSHELRTPLNAIIGFSQLLDRQTADAYPDKEYARYAQLISSSGQHLLALINDLLEMSKIEAGRFDLAEEPVALASAVTDVVSLMEVQARAKSIDIDVDLRGLDVGLVADPKALRQILLNLLSNAVKFTPPGGCVDITGERAPDGALRIHVRDSGVGIPADAIERVFAPFERVVRDRTRSVEGTGLGLSITRGLVLLHGGTIGLDSTVGRGTTATVTLPASRVTAVDRPGAPAPRSAS
jgi:signal transduction histidine kinase